MNLDEIQRPIGRLPALRGKWVALAFAFSLVVSSFAADISASFDAANKLYEQGKFAEAASAYEKMVESGTVSSAVYFNLGNALFKSGQIGRAIAALRTAEKLAPRDADVRANLQFIRARVQGPTGTAASWQHWLTTLTVNEWAVLTAVILWIWLGLLVAIQFRPALKQSVRTALWCGALGIVLCSGCTYAAWSSESSRTAIVVVPDAVLHNGPLDEAPTSATVRDGAELAVIDSKNNWLQVRVDNQHSGWLKREQVIIASGW
jgi:tetratricopeptide (TPR) repeat protein